VIPPELRIRAARARHPWRVVFAVVLVALVVGFIVDAAGRDAYDWPKFGQYIFDPRIMRAAVVTLELTFYSMLIAIVLGVVLAVMRQSPNKVFGVVSWTFIWAFRGTPVYVQLVLWGFATAIYKVITFGIPTRDPWWTITTKDLVPLFWIAVIGLALNEAAYMAEIVRAGLLSVGRGQVEAATALGMGWWQTMRKVVLPQAMRIIIPPTGNELISMLKTTSLVTAVPFTLDLYTRARDISSETLNFVPMMLVASAWYLAFTSLLMVGQFFLERYFSKGQVRRKNAGRSRTSAARSLATDGGAA
jgi:polar amino acid transport system permease protein